MMMSGIKRRDGSRNEVHQVGNRVHRWCVLIHFSSYYTYALTTSNCHLPVPLAATLPSWTALRVDIFSFTIHTASALCPVSLVPIHKTRLPYPPLGRDVQLLMCACGPACLSPACQKPLCVDSVLRLPPNIRASALDGVIQ